MIIHLCTFKNRSFFRMIICDYFDLNQRGCAKRLALWGFFFYYFILNTDIRTIAQIDRLGLYTETMQEHFLMYHRTNVICRDDFLLNVIEGKMLLDPHCCMNRMHLCSVDLKCGSDFNGFPLCAEYTDDHWLHNTH